MWPCGRYLPKNELAPEMPRRKKQAEAKRREPRAATSDNIYTVNLRLTPHCLKSLLARENFKFLKIGCGCGVCMPIPEPDGQATGRHRPTADEFFEAACSQPTPSIHHARSIFEGAMRLESRLKLLHRGLLNIIRARWLSPDHRTRALQYLDYFDVDMERRNREARERAEVNKKLLLEKYGQLEASEEVPSGSHPS